MASSKQQAASSEQRAASSDYQLVGSILIATDRQALLATCYQLITVTNPTVTNRSLLSVTYCLLPTEAALFVDCVGGVPRAHADWTDARHRRRV